MGTSKRLLSLDVFRGLTIAAMLLVNNPGTWEAIYPPLEHAEWNGCTPTDLIFPFFLFIVGVAIPISFGNRLELGQDKRKLYLQIIRRTIILFLLGLFLNSLSIMMGAHPTLNPIKILSDLRIPGVLQRIALCYFFASLIFLNFRIHAQIFITSLLVVGYWLLMTVIPIPVDQNGIIVYQSGILEKGVNVAAFIDNIFLKGHMWSVTKTWDPEGLLSTVPAIATTLFGVFTGNWLRLNIPDSDKLIGMFIMGNVGVILGYLISLWFPLNKSIWSSSYTVFTAGIAVIFLALCYWLIDVKGCQRGIQFFLVYGTNAITVFVLSGIFARILLFIKIPQAIGNPVSIKAFFFNNLLASWLLPEDASLLYAILFIILWYGIMYIFYSRKIFIKI